MLRTRLIAGSIAGLVLSAVFATCLLAMGTFETWFEGLRVRENTPAPLTLRLPPVIDREPQVSESGGLRTEAYTVARGETISSPGVARIVAVFESARRPLPKEAIVGLWFIYFLIALLVTTYLRAFSPSRGALLRTQVGILALIAITLALCRAALLLTNVSIYALPIAALSLWVALYVDRRSAVMIALACAFLGASFVGFRLSALLVFLATGVTAALTFIDRKHSRSMVLAGAMSGFAGAGMLVAAKALFEGGIDVPRDIARFMSSDILGAFAGGLGSGIFAFAFEALAVLALGAVSRIKLLDLSDLEHPLLQKMARDAPGSWEHCRTMADLAETAAAAIHADALLTRVGAYYHDLGKTIQAKYFVENLDPGETSPHAELDPDVSADAIMAHVVEGVRILREGGIPEAVVEFSYTHHGTSVVEYFWHKCLAQGNPRNLSESFFRYPGMRPRTKETAILMLIDSIEAASRTIDPPERDRFEQMVQRVIFVKLRQGQLDESGLTIEELRIVSSRIVDTLVKSRHKRVRYPWQETKAGQAALPLPGVATEEGLAKDRAQMEQQAERERQAEKASKSTPPPGPVKS